MTKKIQEQDTYNTETHRERELERIRKTSSIASVDLMGNLLKIKEGERTELESSLLLLAAEYSPRIRRRAALQLNAKADDTLHKALYSIP